MVDQNWVRRLIADHNYSCDLARHESESIHPYWMKQIKGIGLRDNITVQSNAFLLLFSKSHAREMFSGSFSSDPFIRLCCSSGVTSLSPLLSSEGFWKKFFKVYKDPLSRHGTTITSFSSQQFSSHSQVFVTPSVVCKLLSSAFLTVEPTGSDSLTTSFEVIIHISYPDLCCHFIPLIDCNLYNL